MRILLIYFSFLILFPCSEAEDRKEIISIMRQQEKAWSNHDLEEFMDGYWKSRSLKFYGSNGLTYGWDKTFGNYKKGYPTKEDTGTLTFKVKVSLK